MVVGEVATGGGDAVATYVPQLIAETGDAAPSEQLISVDGTLVSADISGFTALSERLAGMGHEGAEQLTDLLNRCFTQMIAVCDDVGGDVIKFGGDALLILLTGPDHARRAAVAMAHMREIVSRRWSTPSVARVELGISQGAHSDRFHFSLIDGGHLELFVAGPGVTATVGCEGEAARGQILVSADAASLLPDRWLGATTAAGSVVLRHRRVLADEPTPSSSGVRDRSRAMPSLDRFLPPALVEQIAVPNPGEHRQVSVAFITVARTDDLSRSEGPEALHDAFCAIAANVREVLAHHEVHWLASDAYENGGKIILTAGAPTATDADEDHMLLAVHELFQMPSPLPLRAGVNRGHVFVGDLGAPGRRTFTIMGDAVNLSARLMQKAQPGQVIVSDEMLSRAQTTFDHEPLEPFMVKGKSKPIEASILRAPRADEAEIEADPAAAACVGREAELARVATLVDSALEGTGCAVELVGDAGIGKSRLVREVLARHEGLVTVQLRGGQYARNTPYFVVRRLLRAILGVNDQVGPAASGERLSAWIAEHAPELAPWIPLIAIVIGADVDPTPEVDRLADEFRRERLVRATADAIAAAERRPVLLIAEDVYWFDEGSLDVLRLLASRATENPWVLIATTRPGQAHAFDETVGAVVIELGPLTPEATLELVTASAAAIDADHGRDLRALAERSGGHPLFAEELVSAALSSDEGDALPETVESLVTTRIDRLAPIDRLLLREAAVSGAVVDVSILADALDEPGYAAQARWRRLGDFVDRDGSTRYRFRQALYRDVAYEGLAYQRRREVHLKLGEEIERRVRGRSSEMSPLLAVHFDQARDHERAWHYSVEAGDDARTGYANGEAITLYERALANEAGATSAADLARVAESLGDVLDLAARYDDAYRAYQRSRRVGRTASEPRLLRKIGLLRQRQGDLGQSLRWLTRSLRSLDEVHDGLRRDRGEAEIALARAGTLHRQGRFTAAATWAERAATAADRAGDRLTQARAYTMLEVTLRTLGRRESVEMARRALELYDGSGDLVGEANVWNNLGIRAYYAGEWSEAVRCYERSRVLRDQAGDVSGGALAANNLAEVLALQGHYAEAEALLVAAVRTWTAAGNAVGAAYGTVNLALVRGRSGEPAEGLELLRTAIDRFEAVGAVGLANEGRIREIELLLLTGEHRRAADLARPLWAALAADDDTGAELIAQLDPLVVFAETRSGDLATAAACLEEARERTGPHTSGHVDALLSLASAELDDVVGQRARAEASRARARRLLDTLDVIALPPVAAALVG